ncbi:MAG: transcriptional repressor [Planctomycetota bacterium]
MPPERRQTRQRVAIRKVITDADGPLSPNEVHERASAEVEHLGLATVYRALNAMVEAGDIKAVELPGQTPRYESADLGHHHHFHCERCGRVFDFDGCPGDLVSLAPEGFVVSSHDIVLYGMCASCAMQS